MSYTRTEATQKMSDLIAMRHDSVGPAGINPALAAILAQLLSSLIPLLLDRCDLNARSMQLRARRGSRNDRNRVNRMIRGEIGLWNYFWYGGRRLTVSCIAEVAAPENLPMLEAYESGPSGS